MTACLALLACLLPVRLAFAQNGESQTPPSKEARKTVTLVRTAKPPAIDGRLNDDVWLRAAKLTDFYQVSPNEFAEPSERTEVYLLYDDDALYVGARLWGRNLTARILKQREFLLGDDHFGVIVDPFNNQRSGYQFLVNPNGVKVDSVFVGMQQDFDWDGIYFAQATADEEGWTAEMAIPFKTISFDPKTETWGINFYRVIARNGNERIAWSSRNRAVNPATAGAALGIIGLKKNGMGLDIAPSLNVRQDLAAGGTMGADPSLDGFYRVTPALNATLTINTDFSATEVDDRQINLTRFSLFFPEKRGFFLRDVDIFEFGGQLAFNNTQNIAASTPTRQNGRPFSSRRVGLSASGTPVGLEAGGKLSGRIGPWDVGALAIRQDRFGTVNPRNVFVGRATVNVLKESKVGFIVTNGDPQSNRGNALIGADLQYVNTTIRGRETLQGELWFQKSKTEGLKGRDSAFGFGLRMPSATGLHWGVGLKRLGTEFNPGLGFIDRRGVHDYAMDLGYTYRKRDGYLRSISSGVDAQRVNLVDGGLQSQVVAVRLVELQNVTSDSLTIRYYGHREAVARAFPISPGLIIPAGVYAFGEYEVDATAFAQRRLSGGLTYKGGDFYNGGRRSISVRMTWRPFKHFRTTSSYQISNIDLRPGSFVARLLTMRTDVVFSSTMSWTNLIQYDNLSEVIGINSRLYWIPVDGREVVVVLNKNLEDRDRAHAFRSTSTDMIGKISYTFRF